jgi:hypothetical protein
MGLFRNQNTHKSKKNDIYGDLIDEINNCKVEDLESLLQKIELKIEKQDVKDRYLLSAKTMVTSKIALKNSK